MQSRWILSQFYTDDNGHRVPVASDYGGKWVAPSHVDSEKHWSLAQVYVNNHQLEAMALDDRLLVCPLLFDPRPIPKQLLDIYSAYGVTADMSFAALLAVLSDAIPQFGQQI